MRRTRSSGSVLCAVTAAQVRFSSPMVQSVGEGQKVQTTAPQSPLGYRTGRRDRVRRPLPSLAAPAGCTD